MEHRSGIRESRALVIGAGALLALAVLHDLDHVRQGRALPLALSLIGTFGTLSAFVLFLWTFRRRDKAVRRVAGALGFITALGLVIIHVLPRWSEVSDPYGEAGVDWLSWLSLVAFIAGGVLLGVVAYLLIPLREALPTDPEQAGGR